MFRELSNNWTPSSSSPFFPKTRILGLMSPAVSSTRPTSEASMRATRRHLSGTLRRFDPRVRPTVPSPLRLHAKVP